jgi:hypothetical protein
MMFLGASAVAIGAAIYLFGSAATADVTNVTFARLVGAVPPPPWPREPTIESEFGFYAPFWVAYGVALIVTARDLPRARYRVPILAVLFFAGGVGRALAWLRAGPPQPAFVCLMVIELTLPLAFILCWAVLPRGPGEQTP